MNLEHVILSPMILKPNHPAPGYCTHIVKTIADFSEQSKDQPALFGVIPLVIYEPFDNNKHKPESIVILNVHDPRENEIIQKEFVIAFDLRGHFIEMASSNNWRGDTAFRKEAYEEDSSG